MRRDKKFFYVYSRDLARALVWITGENFYIFDNKDYSEGKVYSFKNTEKLQEALGTLNDLRKKLHS